MPKCTIFSYRAIPAGLDVQLTWFRFWIGYASIGGMTEWFMGLVLKTSAGQPAVGSNPTPSASVIAVGGTIPQGHLPY